MTQLAFPRFVATDLRPGIIYGVVGAAAALALPTLLADWAAEASLAIAAAALFVALRGRTLPPPPPVVPEVGPEPVDAVVEKILAAGSAVPAPPARREPEQDRVIEAVSRGRATLQIDPIVGLPSRRPMLRFGRLALRDVAGRSLELPPQLNADLVMELDLLGVALAGAKAEGSRTCPIMLRICGVSLANPAFRAELRAVLEDDALLTSRLILVAPLDDLVGPSIAAGVDDLVAAGFRFAGDARHLDMTATLDLLVRVPGVAYVCQQADKLIAAAGDEGAIEGFGLPVIATDVTTERQVVELLDLYVGFAAGPLFKPAAPMAMAA